MNHRDEQTPIHERWTARPAGEGEEAAAGALLRAAAEHGPVGEKRLAEIQARLRRSRQQRAFVRPAPRLAQQVVFAAVFVLCGGVLSASVIHVMRRPPKQPEVPPAPTVENPKKPVRRPSGKHASVEAVPSLGAPEAPAPALPPPPPPQVTPAALVPSSPLEAQASLAMPRLPSLHRRVALKETPSLVPVAAPIERSAPSPSEARPTPPGPMPIRTLTAMPSSPTQPTPFDRLRPTPMPVQAMPNTPAPEPSRLARESRWLASAIAKLRQEGQPEQALAILDQHRSELGSGALASEANATRIETLLRLGRNAQALVLLDGRKLSAQGLEREMLVARAELRADKGCTSAAVHDFDLVLSSPGHADAITERALYGRATCRAKSGDWEGARGDFTSYLNDFPQGRFTQEARSALSQQIR
jgi:hypothetical protein